MRIKRKAARDVDAGDVALLRGRYRRVLSVDEGRRTGVIVVRAAAPAAGGRELLEALMPGAIVRTRTDAPVRRRNR